MNDEEFKKLQEQYRKEKNKRDNIQVLNKEIDELEYELKAMRRCRDYDGKVCLAVERTLSFKVLARLTLNDSIVFMEVVLAKKKERLAQLKLELL